MSPILRHSRGTSLRTRRPAKFMWTTAYRHNQTIGLTLNTLFTVAYALTPDTLPMPGPFDEDITLMAVKGFFGIVGNPLFGLFAAGVSVVNFMQFTGAAMPPVLSPFPGSVLGYPRGDFVAFEAGALGWGSYQGSGGIGWDKHLDSRTHRKLKGGEDIVALTVSAMPSQTTTAQLYWHLNLLFKVN